MLSPKGNFMISVVVLVLMLGVVIAGKPVSYSLALSTALYAVVRDLQTLWSKHE